MSQSDGPVVAPLGRRFVAALIDRLGPAVIGGFWFWLGSAFELAAGQLVMVGVVFFLLGFAWVMVQWWLYGSRKAGLGFLAARLELVGIADGKPIGWGRMALRTLISYALWSLVVPGIIMVIFMVVQERRQNWADLAVKSLAITRRTTSFAAVTEAQPTGRRTSSTVGLPSHLMGGAEFAGSYEMSAPIAPIDHVPLHPGRVDPGAAGPGSRFAPPAQQPPPGPEQGFGRTAMLDPAVTGQQQPPVGGGQGFAPGQRFGHGQQQVEHGTDPGTDRFGPGQRFGHGQQSPDDPQRHSWGEFGSAPERGPAQRAGGSVPDQPPMRALEPDFGAWQSSPDRVASPEQAASPAQARGPERQQPPVPPVQQTQPPAAELSGAGVPGAPVRIRPRQVSNDDADGTRLVAPGGRSRPADEGWHVRLDDGRDLPVTGLVLIGRAPSPRSDESGAVLIPAGEPGKTVSKTHLALGVDQRGMYVVDRGSTNGTALMSSKGELDPCPAHQQVRLHEGQVVSFGERQLQVLRSPAR